MVTGVVPHVGMPIIPPGCLTVTIGGPFAARATDIAACTGPPDMIAKGSATVLIGCLLAARQGDQTVHGGAIVMGLPTVIIGDGAGGGGGGGGGAGGPGGAGGSKGTVVVGDLNGMPIVLNLDDGTITVGKGIIIKSDDPKFQSQTVNDVIAIGKTDTGGKLLNSIDNSGKTVTIVPTAGGNETSYDNGADRFTGADGKPGPGTDATVGYNKDRQKIGDEPWETRPPAIGLAHELVHADQANHGTQTPGMTDNDAKPDPADPSKTAQEKTREVEAAGIPPNDKRDFTENKIRDEWNPKQPQRQWY
jgi:type VI secretion system secreted protein VgrG